ncbi:C-X-C motif chemokine 11-like [Poecilia formosa]|uniref:C-X-C motif chemokine 11-like n=1 Tax=Poecilia formosa TaxID=48698 RepID=A0A087XVJ0_POEFO|nr:PREDICTED: C-X-C motif chemokine 11-like [Poecilia formosa]
MKSAVIGFVACLFLLCAQAQPANRSNKCKCSSSFLNRVRLQSILTEPVVYHPSTFCPRTEIIVTLGNKEKCVDPKSRIGQLILNLKNRSRKTGAVYTTMVPAHTSTSGSTQQATSRL